MEIEEQFEEKGVPLIRKNYNINSAEILELIKIMREATPLSIVAQDNTGQPEVYSYGKVSYSKDIEDYILYIPKIIDNGANLIGGC